MQGVGVPLVGKPPTAAFPGGAQGTSIAACSGLAAYLSTLAGGVFINSSTLVCSCLGASGPGQCGVVQQAVAGGLPSVSVTVTSLSTQVGTITTATVPIPGGSSSGTTFFVSVGAGTASITAAATGYAGASAQATVETSYIDISTLGATVGANLESQNSFFLTDPAPSGGLTVTLSVSHASLGSMLLAANATDPGGNTITLTLNANALSGSYYVYGLGSAGTASYTISAPGYATASDTIFLAPSGIILLPGYEPTSASVSGGPETLTVYTVQLTTDGNNTPIALQPTSGHNSALTVTLTSSNTQAGTVTSAVIPPASQTGVATFTAIATGLGPVTVSVIPPTGWTLPSQYSTYSIGILP